MLKDVTETIRLGVEALSPGTSLRAKEFCLADASLALELFDAKLDPGFVVDPLPSLGELLPAAAVFNLSPSDVAKAADKILQLEVCVGLCVWVVGACCSRLSLLFNALNHQVCPHSLDIMARRECRPPDGHDFALLPPRRDSGAAARCGSAALGAHRRDVRPAQRGWCRPILARCSAASPGARARAGLSRLRLRARDARTVNGHAALHGAKPQGRPRDWCGAAPACS